MAADQPADAGDWSGPITTFYRAELENVAGRFAEIESEGKPPYKIC